ncbi:putative mitochondrial import inner membrane translocase subunit TIM21 [Nicotiana tabacum]|uniref:Mitochondrial import inner membrane translocase subunit Tim21 n=1 Tax=Nicotiana tabacum TaxID=4097 RepID=A0A1S3YGL2_TOBAC|nr:probable mitochondrial import inner membrane translocase subunit TIM21 [Nicotiana tomentosiformis]XP_016451173.1 PREDICTED: probable mitochondrial import inner membrane translocase subunit TIM21 [Nicotiana tabacum]
MQHVRRSGVSLKTRWWSNVVKSSNKFDSLLEHMPSRSLSNLGISRFSSVAAESAAFNVSAKRELVRSGCARRPVHASCPASKVINEPAGLPVLYRNRRSTQCLMTFRSPFQLVNTASVNPQSSCFARSFASKASGSTQKQSEARKDVSTVEDPFDAPTYNIPEKPVTFTEGASYSLVILAGLAVAAGAAYGVFKELIFQPKEYKIFDKALKRIQNDGQVSVRIGSPVTGYGSESRNRAARQRIPNRIWTDEDGVEHVEVNFYIRGPHGAGKVYTEMFQDKVDKQWKFTYLIVEIKSPSPAQLMLESYVPA